MGTCQSRRGTIPADSIHVMLGVKDEEDLKRRYSQEDECRSIDTSFRPSSLDQFLDTFDEQDVQHRRPQNKRGTMETSLWSLESADMDEEGPDSTSPMPTHVGRLVDKVNSSQRCSALVEPKPTLSQCSLAA